MKVKELINVLKELNQEDNIAIGSDYGGFYIDQENPIDRDGGEYYINAKC